WGGGGSGVPPPVRSGGRRPSRGGLRSLKCRVAALLSPPIRQRALRLELLPRSLAPLSAASAISCSAALPRAQPITTWRPLPTSAWPDGPSPKRTVAVLSAPAN